MTFLSDAATHERQTEHPINGGNYGTFYEDGEPGSDEFAYVEFSGKDGRTCPTCKGTGRIAKEQEDELVALIPYNDQRLKPPRTKYYVILAILICLLGCGLTLFFLLPRAVTISEDKIVNFTVCVNKNMSLTVITVKNRFNISNTNYFDVKISAVDVEAFFDQVSVGGGKLKSIPLYVPARTIQSIEVEIDTNFNKENQLEFMWELCTNPKRQVHDIVLKFQATLTTWYLQHSEQNSLTLYRYLDCSIKNSHNVNTRCDR
uniref:Transmembrane protein 106A n=1 Tax=Ciona savignyi TaxID=51511 RepID=H2Z2P7_CIOSA